MRFRVPAALAAVWVAKVVAYDRFLRPRQERWGATDEEAHGPLPGDSFTVEPAAQTTRAITIDAPPEDVWPWLTMIGAERGGFYSYDWLENLFGLDIHSTNIIVPSWQERAVGDFMCANAKGDGGWIVAEVIPHEALVVRTANPKTRQPFLRDEPPLYWEFTWTFVLKDLGDGRTRLIVRERVGFGTRFTRYLMAPMGFVSFVMTRKMMLGIKTRAEAMGSRRAPLRNDALAG